MDMNTTSSTAEPERTGKVVRLHFCCRAELPMGSVLRVTGSSLWAQDQQPDPADTAASVGDATGDSNNNYQSHSHHHHSFNSNSSSLHHGHHLYSSSVEMVTTPEDYPYWRTRTPVVIVLTHGKRTIQHHYYRYLVVSPGGRDDIIDDNDNTHGDDYNISDEDLADGMHHHLDDSDMVQTHHCKAAVMEWEDPFGVLTHAAQAVSSVSLASGAGHKPDYRNLPYRTLDIDCKTGTVIVMNTNTGNNNAMNNEETVVFSVPTSGDHKKKDMIVRIDHWNYDQDDSFQSYVIRRAMQPSQQQQHPPPASAAMMMGMGGGSNNPASAGTSGAATPPSFPPNNRIFFVCFHLPVVVVQHQKNKEWRASWSESILAKSEGSQILSTYEGYWVGTVSTHPKLETDHDKQQVRSLLKEMNCIPIFLEDSVLEAHYYGFCKQVLWPAFHNIDLLDLSTCGWLHDNNNKNNDGGDNSGGNSDHQASSSSMNAASDWDQSRLDHWWDAYTSANAQFCQVMHNLSRPGDIMWIHDYHLALLPQQLTNMEVQRYGWKISRKVFFLHIPFPTSQVFRELECGERILEGMLEADVVGFHAFDHARHFLNAAKRILGLNYESLVGGLIGVNFRGKTVLVTMSNVSIEPRMVDVALLLPSVQESCDALKNKHSGRKIICGLDIGQRLSGINLKLLAYERMLQDYPTWQSQVVMVERVLIPGSRKTDEETTAKEVRALVQRITAKFGPDVIDYQELAGATLPMDQRLSLWKAGDVLMSTSIREGLNHWPMEFIHVHKAPETPGVVINSEFTAINSILNGALRVNPFDIQNTVVIMDKALSMNMEEREGRRYRDIDFVSTSPSDKWVKNVLRDLRDAALCQPNETSSQTSTPHGMITPLRKDLPTTSGFLAHESAMAFGHLSFSALRNAYQASTRRVIISDFNGTIVLKEPPGKYLKRDILGTSGNKPPQQVIQALHVLCQDPQNTVYVVSGDSSENVLNALGHVPNLGLAVSNGACFSPPVPHEEMNQPRRWLTFDLGVNWDEVKKVALPVLAKYTARSNGSFVKLTSFSIGWSYYSCDPEWGSLQASHLVLELESELRTFDVRFVTLKGIVEIVPRKLNKGLIVKKVLGDVSRQNPGGVDFCLCMGDDISDEKMFTSVFSFLAECGQHDGVPTGPRALNEDGTVEETMPGVAPMESESNATITKDTDSNDSPVYAFTVAVGKKQTHASSYVNDAQEVANALVLLAEGQVPAGGVPVDLHSATDMFD